jgi:YgiT-type zinc finger domain-containing protein
MMAIHSCPICAGATSPYTLPVSVRREGHTVLELALSAWRCGECGYVDVEDATRESLIATLEEHTQPGDDIVFPVEE